jgi:hypothetical protein
MALVRCRLAASGCARMDVMIIGMHRFEDGLVVETWIFLGLRSGADSAWSHAWHVAAWRPKLMNGSLTGSPVR